MPFRETSIPKLFLAISLVHNICFLLEILEEPVNIISPFTKVVQFHFVQVTRRKGKGVKSLGMDRHYFNCPTRLLAVKGSSRAKKVAAMYFNYPFRLLVVKVSFRATVFLTFRFSVFYNVHTLWQKDPTASLQFAVEIPKLSTLTEQ